MTQHGHHVEAVRRAAAQAEPALRYRLDARNSPSRPPRPSPAAPVRVCALDRPFPRRHDLAEQALDGDLQFYRHAGRAEREGPDGRRLGAYRACPAPGVHAGVVAQLGEFGVNVVPGVSGLAVSTNAAGTAWRSCVASRSAAISWSSSQSSSTGHASRESTLILTQSDEVLRPAQPVQAPGPLWADAANRNVQAAWISAYAAAGRSSASTAAAGSVRQRGERSAQPWRPLCRRRSPARSSRHREVAARHPGCRPGPRSGGPP